MNPFKEFNSKDKIRYKDWKWMAPKPYDKKSVSPYTKARIILMNGTTKTQSAHTQRRE